MDGYIYNYIYIKLMFCGYKHFATEDGWNVTVSLGRLPTMVYR